VGAVEPRSDFDVDIHPVKVGDTYLSVSQKYYDSTQYAEALKAFNRGAPIDATRQIEVPPLVVIRKVGKRQPDAIPAPSGIQQVGRTETVGDGVEWGTAGAKPRGEVRNERYIVPREGMTYRNIAFELYGTERDWGKIDNKQNYRYRPDEKLPKGAELIVPIEDVRWR